MVATSCNGLRRGVFVVVFWLCVESKSPAKTTGEVLFNFLYQSGHSGQQVYDNSGDETLTLFEPMVFIGTEIQPDTNLSLSALFDTWTSASAQKFDSATGASALAFDGQTLASQPSTSTPPTTTAPSTNTTTGNSDNSGQNSSASNGFANLEHRQAINLGLSHKAGSWVFSPRVGYSSQLNYMSRTAGMTVEKNLAHDNFTLAFSASMARDTSNFFDASKGKFTAWIAKNSDTYEVSATQILSPYDLCLFGVGTTTQQGYLAASRNTVVVNGQRIQEILPAKRQRQFYTARYVHAFNDFLAWHTDYRYYFDDWGIAANTIEPFLALSFADDDGLIRLGYRMHSQNASTYYVTSLPTAHVYMTSDSDLSQFNANDASLLGSYTFDSPNTFFTTMQLGAGVMVYQRSNDLTLTVLQASLGVTL